MKKVWLKSSVLGIVAAALFAGASVICMPTNARGALGEHLDPNVRFGIGAVLSSAGDFPRITELVPDGAAERDGHLKVNDRIAGVAQGNGAFVDCSGMELDKIVEMIRGKKGTTVRLQIIQAGVDISKRVVFPLVRAELKIPQMNGNGGENLDAVLNAERQAKLDEAVKHIVEAERKLIAENMSKEIDRVVAVTALDANGRKLLETASGKAVDQCLEQTGRSVADDLRAQFKQVPAAQLDLVFTQISNNAATYAKWLQSKSGNWPADQPAWQDALTQTLSPQQAATWEAAEAKHKQTVEGEIASFLNTVARLACDQVKSQMNAKVERIEGVLVLPKDRRDKLNAAANAMIEEFGEKTKARAEQGLLAMGDEERKAVLNQRQQGFFEWVQPAPESEWDEGLAKLLTPEETTRLAAAEDDHKSRRAAAMGEMLVAVLDEKIAFTAAQRKQLEPIAQRLVKGVAELVGDQEMDNYSNYSVSSFYGAIADASASEIQAILDPVQWRHWQETAKLKDEPDPNMYIQVALHLPAQEEADKPRAAAEPEDVERAISDFLAEKSRAQEEKFLAENTLKAEEINRVVHLSGDASERLQTAARGYAAELMDGWDTNAERMVRSAIGNVSPEMVKTRLDSIQSYQFQQFAMQAQRFSGHAGQQSVWDATLKGVLSPEQNAAWKVETDARAAYRQKAVSALVVAAFDQRANLTPDQWTKLGPMVDKFLAEYGDEIGSYFMYSRAWFLQSYSIFIPIAGIPESDLKSVLTTDQWDHWTGSNEFSNASQYWSNLDQNHQRKGKGK